MMKELKVINIFSNLTQIEYGFYSILSPFSSIHVNAALKSGIFGQDGKKGFHNVDQLLFPYI